jgi:hypothetical protein
MDINDLVSKLPSSIVKGRTREIDFDSVLSDFIDDYVSYNEVYEPLLTDTIDTLKTLRTDSDDIYNFVVRNLDQFIGSTTDVLRRVKLLSNEIHKLELVFDDIYYGK